MSPPNYQALGFNLEKDIFAILDLKMSQIITAAVILFIVPTSFLAYFLGNFGSSMAFLLLFLYFIKKSARTFLVCKNKTKQLTIYILNGFTAHKKIIESSNIEKFVIDKAKNKYRIAIILKNGKAIAPVKLYTSRLYLNSLNKTINLLSQCLKFSSDSPESDAKINQYEAQSQEKIKLANKKYHQYVPAKHWLKQTNKSAIKYIHRPSLPSVTRLSKTNKNPITVMIILIVVAIIELYFL